MRSSMAEEGFKLPGLSRPPTKGLGKGQRKTLITQKQETPSWSELGPLPRSIRIQSRAPSPTRQVHSPTSMTIHHQTTALTKGICSTSQGKQCFSYPSALSWVINPAEGAHLRKSFISNSSHWTNTRR